MQGKRGSNEIWNGEQLRLHSPSMIARKHGRRRRRNWNGNEMQKGEFRANLLRTEWVKWYWDARQMKSKWSHGTGSLGTGWTGWGKGRVERGMWRREDGLNRLTGGDGVLLRMKWNELGLGVRQWERDLCANGRRVRTVVNCGVKSNEHGDKNVFVNSSYLESKKYKL